MQQCNISEELLMAFAEGEAGEQSEWVAQTLTECEDCQNKLDAIHAMLEETSRLKPMIGQAVGEVDTLAALRSIRERIEQSEEQSLGARLQGLWGTLLGSPATGWAAAAACALVLAVMWPSEKSVPLTVAQQDSVIPKGAISLALARIEQVEVGSNMKATVYESKNSSTTLIWVEPGQGEDGALGNP